VETGFSRPLQRMETGATENKFDQVEMEQVWITTRPKEVFPKEVFELPS
jgi:hypothetical protein